jgi:hypothetical protein
MDGIERMLHPSSTKLVLIPKMRLLRRKNLRDMSPYGQMIPSKEKKMFTNISLDDYWFNGSFRRRKLEVQGLQ